MTRRAELERSTSALRTRSEQLTADLDHDVVTGCRSRRWLESRLSSLASAGGSGSMLMFDIDRFKLINDTYGHAIGDDVLARFGLLLVAATTNEHQVARYGGEEFLVIATCCGSEAGAALAERIRLDIAAHDWGSIAPGLELTTSVGIATGRLADGRNLLISADEALLEAKRLGRNRSVSSPSFISIDVTPVSFSPFNMHHCIGAAPRYFGRREACMFIEQNFGRYSISGGKILP